MERILTGVNAAARGATVVSIDKNENRPALLLEHPDPFAQEAKSRRC
jgi:hypothetical protein